MGDYYDTGKPEGNYYDTSPAQVIRMTAWQTIGNYEYEYDENGYTGWYRCVGGRLADGRWPQWRTK